MTISANRVFTGASGVKPVFEGEGRGYGPAPLENFVRAVRLGANARRRCQPFSECPFENIFFKQAWQFGYSLSANGALSDV